MQLKQLYDTIEASLDALGSELHALQRDAAGGHYIDGARRALVEGLEMDMMRVLHQLETLDTYDLSSSGLNLADPALLLDAEMKAALDFGKTAEQHLR